MNYLNTYLDFDWNYNVYFQAMEETLQLFWRKQVVIRGLLLYLVKTKSIHSTVQKSLAPYLIFLSKFGHKYWFN